MADETYQGWSSWDTWATELWSDNDQPLYNQKWAILKRAKYYKDHGKYDEAKLRKGLRSYYGRVTTFARKQGEEINNKKINWKELEDAGIQRMKEEYGE